MAKKLCYPPVIALGTRSGRPLLFFEYRGGKSVNGTKAIKISKRLAEVLIAAGFGVCG